MKSVINVTAILDPCYKDLPFLSSAESKEIFDHLEQLLLLIGMYSLHYSEDNLEAASDERNEEQSSPIEGPAKTSRNSEDEDKVNSLSYLVIL